MTGTTVERFSFGIASVFDHTFWYADKLVAFSRVNTDAGF